MKLTSSKQFDAVYSCGEKRHTGPLSLAMLPNDLGHLRLGLSVPRRVGHAVRRNRIKRLLRETIRLMQSDLPRGYDLVVNVRPHEPLTLAEYQKIISRTTRGLHQVWAKKQQNNPA